MHGIINRGLECFINDIYGADKWAEVQITADIEDVTFETMLVYDDLITEQIITALCKITTRKRSEILEDFGTYIVSEHSSSRVRKLLRLGGHDYIEFLYSLEDLHDRIKAVLPELKMPLLALDATSVDKYVLSYENEIIGYGAVFLGMLRTMADDYEVLVIISHQSRVISGIAKDIFEINLMDSNWNEAASEPFRAAS